MIGQFTREEVETLTSSTWHRGTIPPIQESFGPEPRSNRTEKRSLAPSVRGWPLCLVRLLADLQKGPVPWSGAREDFIWYNPRK